MKLKRRKFLKGLTAFGLASLVAPLWSCLPGGGSGSKKTLYRFQTRGASVCTACRNHGRYKVFADEAVANHTRAHKGCNCRVVVQKMPKKRWNHISAYGQNGVIDLRAVYG